MIINEEKTIELDGFIMDNGEVLISDSFAMGNWKKVKIHIEPSMLKFLIEEHEQKIEQICDISIF